VDLLTVSKKDYSADKLVELEDTASLIWTERFQAPGDFTLTTSNISPIRKLLPERSLVTLRDTNVVMMVDNHAIADQGSGMQLTVTGRTLDAFLKKRIWTGSKYSKTETMNQHYTVRQAVEVWLWNAIVNGTTNDVVNPDVGWNPANQLPNVVVTDSVPASADGPSHSRKVKSGFVYDQMFEFLKAGKLGIRIIRPNGTSGKRVDVAADGTFSTTHVNPFTKLRFDIYQGRNVSGRVIFSYKVGDLISPSYLWDSTEFRTGAFVDGDAATKYVQDPDAVPGPNSGWNRMDGYLDGGSKGTKQTVSDFTDSLDQHGLKALRKDWKHRKMISTQISPLSEYRYGRDYRLGDRVMVQGNYGISDVMWVVEFIRSQDSNGYNAYPTLAESPA
jgi:hypothetical protein